MKQIQDELQYFNFWVNYSFKALYICLIGLGDAYKIGIGRCLQWNIVMDNDIGRQGRGLLGGVPEALIRNLYTV